MNILSFFFIFLLLYYSSVSSQNIKKVDSNILLSINSTALIKDKTDSSKIKIWILFSDKSCYNDIRKYAESFSQNSLERRIKRCNIETENLFDITDLPVCDEYIKKVESLGIKIKTTSKWINGVSAFANYEQILLLSELPFVIKIQPVAVYKKDSVKLNYSLPLFQRDENQFNVSEHLIDYGLSFNQLNQIGVIEAHSKGYTGKGVTICMLDTGFLRTHKAFDSLSVIAEYDFIHNDSITSNEVGIDSTNQHNHGTMVLSAIGGYYPGFLVGPAYQSNFILAKTEEISSETIVEEDWWVKGLEWADSLGADIVSSSLGYSDWYKCSDFDGNTAITTRAAKLASRKGIVVCTAMGNDRWREEVDGCSIIAPADADSVISVGAVNIYGELASFSSIGPTYDGRTKPDVMACGVNTYCVSPYSDTKIITASGTSLATPLVAGCCALILQAHPDWTPAQVINALHSTASQSCSPNNYYGWGIVNVDKAIEYTLPPECNNEMYKYKTLAKVYKKFPNPFEYNITIEYEIFKSRIVNHRLQICNPQSSIHNKNNLMTNDLITNDNSILVSLKIYNISGELVKTLVNTQQSFGMYAVEWDGKNDMGYKVPSGVYVYKLSGNGFSNVGKMVLIR